MVAGAPEVNFVRQLRSILRRSTFIWMRVIGISVTTQPSTFATTPAAERPGKYRPWRRSVNGTALRSTDTAANAASAAGNHRLTVLAHSSKVARPAPNTCTIGAALNPE